MKYSFICDGLEHEHPSYNHWGWEKDWNRYYQGRGGDITL